MANLGDFLELVFVAKVYQRFNPENYNKIEIQNKIVSEDFTETVLGSDNIKSFLIEKFSNNQGTLISQTKEYKNYNITDTLCCELQYQSNIKNFKNFVATYTDDDLAKNSILEDYVIKVLDNGRVPQKIKKASDKGLLKKNFDDLRKKLEDKKTTISEFIKKDTTEFSKFVNKIQSTGRRNTNRFDIISQQNVKRLVKNRKQELNNILKIDINKIPEIIVLIKQRNKYLTDSESQNLKFIIKMVGSSKKEEKTFQGKTDIKLTLLVKYTNKAGQDQQKQHVYNISLKYASKKIETTTQIKIDAISRVLEEFNKVENITENERVTNQDHFKKQICDFLFDSMDLKINDSIITFDEKSNFKRFTKNELLKKLDEFQKQGFKGFTKKIVKEDEDIIILYNSTNFIRFKKQKKDGKISWNVYLDKFFDDNLFKLK